MPGDSCRRGRGTGAGDHCGLTIVDPARAGTPASASQPGLSFRHPAVPASPPGRHDGIRNVTALLPCRDVQPRMRMPGHIPPPHHGHKTRPRRDPRDEHRPNIVLVHGAWAEGSCWSGVIERGQGDVRRAAAPGLLRLHRRDGRPGLEDAAVLVPGRRRRSTNREIGDRLFLSPRTVSSHLYRSYPKLGVRRPPPATRCGRPRHCPPLRLGRGDRGCGGRSKAAENR